MNRTVGTGAVGWVLTHTEAVPEGDGWLTPEERAVERGLRMVRRRADWRLGRWAAKQALAAWVPARAIRLDQVGILARGDDDGWPEIHGLDPPVPSLSLSHRDGVGLAVVASPGCRIGCDLERVEPRSARFPRDWFTPSECERIDGADPDRRDELVTTVWSAKESVLKAVGEGLRRDTRSVEVDLGTAPAVGAAWVPLVAHDTDGGTDYACWVRRLGHHVGVVAVDVASASTNPPERLFRGWRAWPD